MDEFLIDENEKFESVVRRRGRLMFPFPVVVFTDQNYRQFCAYLNQYAAEILDGVPRVDVKISQNFVVFLPSKSINSRAVTSKQKNGVTSISVSSLRGIIQDGARYRVYPFKGGLIFNRWEPIENWGGAGNDIV